MIVLSRGRYGRPVVVVQVHTLRKRLPVLERAQAVAQKTEPQHLRMRAIKRACRG